MDHGPPDEGDNTRRGSRSKALIRADVDLAKLRSFEKLVASNMKTLIFGVAIWIGFSAMAFARIGEDEKQIEARYGKAGKDLGNHGSVHEVGYISGGFMILVDFVNGVSQREGFAKSDTSVLTDQDTKSILTLSAPEGTTWEAGPAKGGDKSWSRSDHKAIAVLPAQGTFLFVQDASFVQPK